MTLGRNSKIYRIEIHYSEKQSKAARIHRDYTEKLILLDQTAYL